MFPGTSRQTPREPDLGSPYRVDLGTAGKNKIAKTEGREKGHRGDKVEIDAMKIKYQAAVEKHKTAVKAAEETKVELDKYGDLLKQLEDAHEHSVNAERERTDAEELKRKKEADADALYQTMKEKMAGLQKVGLGVKK